MVEEPKSGAVAVKPDRLPDRVLFLYQPQGLEDCVTPSKLIAWETADASVGGFKIETVKIFRGINCVPYNVFLRITDDPECAELFRKRQLIRICDGDNPFVIKDNAQGVYGSVTPEAIVSSTFDRELLVNWENWLKQQNWDKSKEIDCQKLLGSVRERMQLLDTKGKSILPTYNPDYPAPTQGDNRLQII